MFPSLRAVYLLLTTLLHSVLRLTASQVHIDLALADIHMCVVDALRKVLHLVLAWACEWLPSCLLWLVPKRLRMREWPREMPTKVAPKSKVSAPNRFIRARNGSYRVGDIGQ